MLARAWIQWSPSKSVLRTCCQKVKTHVKQKYISSWQPFFSFGELLALIGFWAHCHMTFACEWNQIQDTSDQIFAGQSSPGDEKHHSINGSKLFSCLSWEPSKWIAKTLFWIWTQGYIHILSMHGSSQGMLFLLSSYGPSMSSRSSSVTSRSALHFAIRDVHRKFQCCKNSIRWFKRAFASVYDISKHKAICLVDTRLSMPKILWEFCETACEYSVTDPFPGVVGLRLFRLLTIAAKLAGEPHQVELKLVTDVSRKMSPPAAPLER